MVKLLDMQQSLQLKLNFMRQEIQERRTSPRVPKRQTLCAGSPMPTAFIKCGTELKSDLNVQAARKKSKF